MNRGTLFERIIKPVLFVLLLLPALRLLWLAMSDGFGANPVEEITHETGLWALRILLLTLAITPLRRLSGVAEWVRLRRMIGLYSFFYAFLHFLTYAWLDQGFDPGLIVDDVIKRPYITFGFITLLLLVPLAATSTNRMMRLLGGKRWKRLHQLVYLCASGAVLHYVWLVKADYLDPLIYLLVLLTLLAFRVPERLRQWPLNWWRTLVRDNTITRDSH